jgi:hypothetical protein
MSSSGHSSSTTTARTPTPVVSARIIRARRRSRHLAGVAVVRALCAARVPGGQDDAGVGTENGQDPRHRLEPVHEISDQNVTQSLERRGRRGLHAPWQLRVAIDGARAEGGTDLVQAFGSDELGDREAGPFQSHTEVGDPGERTRDQRDRRDVVSSSLGGQRCCSLRACAAPKPLKRPPSSGNGRRRHDGVVRLVEYII